MAGFAWWGFHAGASPAPRALLAIGAPAVGFGIWGALDFRFAGRWAEPLRLAEELGLSGLAALGFWAAGQHALALSLAALSVVHHALVYALGQRLLKPRAPTP